MKARVFGLLAISALILCMLSIVRQAQASTSISIIGGTINANKTSHITINTVPGSRSGLVMFYRCTTGATIRVVFSNQNANSLGRYTWQWTNGAPCSGSARAVANSHVGSTYIVAQKVFMIISPITPTPVPTATVPITGVNGNPWGYNFTPGNLIFTPNSAFCDAGYFKCVTTFWKSTNGYVAECGNGDYTHSGGVSGACSKDGGVFQILYSH